jgi:hypothetical protein
MLSEARAHKKDRRKWFQELSRVWNGLPQFRTGAVSTLTPKHQEFARLFYQRWHTADPDYGLDQLWALARPPPAPEAAVEVVLVGLAPKDTLITRPVDASGDVVSFGLELVWNPRRGMKRTRPVDAQPPQLCATCGETARFGAKRDPALLFCGRDCFNVHVGDFIAG